MLLIPVTDKIDWRDTTHSLIPMVSLGVKSKIVDRYGYFMLK
jgi:hypothetical protein